MKGTVVLNLLFKPVRYEPKEISNIFNWISFFRSCDMRVIATPPADRKEIFEELGITEDSPNNKLFMSYPVLSFDTCDRWRAGLQKAAEFEEEYYYLWAADFDFSEASKSAANKLIEYEEKIDLVVGTINAKGRKQAIDEEATFPLLSHWFPEECKRMEEEEEEEEKFTKPRSELLRFSGKFLKKALRARWYPTEQTINLILQCFWSEETEDIFSVKALGLKGDVSDSDEARGKVKGVIEQVERMELWLKYIWRDRKKVLNKDEYIRMCEESSEIVKTACEKFFGNS
ncbi:MAG: hypothetical protein ACYSWZ_05550 [Planctomycetota bacterium]|jgi:hypothetical protein